MKRENKKKIVYAVLFVLALLATISGSLAFVKSDFFGKEYQQCGIVSCYTQYYLKNPTAQTVTIDTSNFNITRVIETRGQLTNITIYFQNRTGSWVEFRPGRTVNLPPGFETKVRVYGTIRPVYSGSSVTYAIDHVPHYLNYDFPEYDIWNQTYNKCVYVNVTYNLHNANPIVNETFPMRLLLNGTNINLSTIRSDWGDLRFGAGTCGNVTADYQHNFVYKNSTNAEVLVHLATGTILNNTPFSVAIYYNNSAATHLEPDSSSLGWGTGGADSPNTRVFTNDKTTDTDALSTTTYNDTSDNNLTSFTTNSVLTNVTIWGLAKRFNSTNNTQYTEHSDGSGTGFSIAFDVRFDNWNQSGTQHLVSLRNLTDVTNTKVYDLLLSSTTTSPPVETIFVDYANGTITNLWGGNTANFAYSTGWLNNTASGYIKNKTNITVSTGTYNLSFIMYDNGDAITGGQYSSFSVSNNSALQDPLTTGSNVEYGMEIDSGSCNTYQTTYHVGTRGFGDCPTGTGIARVNGITRWSFIIDLDNDTVIIYQDGVNIKNESVPSTFVIRSIFWSDNSIKYRYDNITLAAVSNGSATTDTQLILNAYYEDGTVTSTNAVSGLQNNVSYPVGLTVRKTSLTGKVTILTFNNTVLLKQHDPFSGAGFPFHENSTSCSQSGNDICTKYVSVGGQQVINSTGDIVGVVNQLNGSIDEIILSSTGTGNISEFDDSFLIAWGSLPTLSFSETLISNLYAPTVSVSISPTEPTFTDDINASITYSDGDANNGTVYVQWRVNGTNVRNATFNNVANGSVVSDILSSGNFSKGSIVNVTAWANDSLYYSGNDSEQVTIAGVKPNPITNLSCSGINKTAINCTWTNPGGDHSNTTANLDGVNVENVSNTTTDYLFGGLLPDSTYNLSFRTVSGDGTLGNSTSNISSTTHNPAPNITSYTPTNLTPTFAENTTQRFNVTATDDDGSPIVYWFKDNVLQALADFWDWVIGLNDQGTYNVTAVVNDSYGAESRVSWAVTVEDTFPQPNDPVFQPNGGLYRTYIPVFCPSTNGYSAVSYYDIQVSVNNGSYQNLSVNNRYGAIDFDITQYDYYTNFTFNCTAIGDAGNASAVSRTFTRDYVNEFYSTTINSDFSFTTGESYTMSIYYDAQSPDNNIHVQYAYADCNGDGLYDYVYNYTAYQPSRIKAYYACAFPSGSVNYEIGVFLSKDDGTSWSRSGCSTDYDYSNNCLVKKTYVMSVKTQ